MPDRTVGLKIFKKGWAHARRKMEKLGSRPEKKLFVREQNCSLPNLHWQSHKMPRHITLLLELSTTINLQSSLGVVPKLPTSKN